MFEKIKGYLGQWPTNTLKAFVFTTVGLIAYWQFTDVSLYNMMTFIMSMYIFYKLYDFAVFANPDEKEVHESCDVCPNCEKMLYVEYSKWINIYRCRNCKFEGFKEPFFYAMREFAYKSKIIIKQKVKVVMHYRTQP